MIGWDSKMRSLVNGKLVSIKVQNTLLHEELGKVQYLFTDKTGTLT